MSTSTTSSEEISRSNPSCIIFLIDQSGSMADRFGGQVEGVSNPTKAQGAADAMNRCLANIAIRCTKDEGVRDYFDLGLIGYGAAVGSVVGGQASDNLLMPVSRVANSPLRVEDRSQKVPDGAGGLVEQKIKFPVWVDAKADGGTPMRQTLTLVKEVVQRWIEAHAGSYPPTIINITDGASTDGDPRQMARQLMNLANANGSNLLLFNMHICHLNTPPILYPANGDGLTDEYARQLFEMSSPLPEKLAEEARVGGLPVTGGSRGFVFNGGLADMIRFLEIGTRISQMLDLRPGF